MLNLENETLAGKLVLEVGSGRGDTTRRLVDMLSGVPDAKLIVTDISDRFFPRLSGEFEAKGVPVQFICTSAQELQGVGDGSVDHLVCSYTLCAINAQSGMVVLALRRFWEVLKAGGRLWLEEEYPVDHPVNPAQSVWAEKWRLLKAAQLLSGQLPFNEISPQVLEELCRLVGFEVIQSTAHTEFYPPEALDFFQQRLDALLAELPDENIRFGFMEQARELHRRAVQVGGMEIPYYRLNARRTVFLPS
jgi:ubiquinone/menaquinone biosynthesis C-methylase UbiE